MGGFGILGKLTILAIIATVIPLGIVGYVSLSEIKDMSEVITQKGDEVLGKVGEQIIEDVGKDAAEEVSAYLEAHLDYTLEDLREDPEFRELAVQPVGQTGYTALHELKTGINRFHINPKVEDLDLHKLATKLPEFWRILEPHLEGTFTKGYYKWEDPDGKIRDKFMVCVPVEGSGYGIAATTYIDEFRSPVVRLSETFKKGAQRQMVAIGIVGVVALLVALIAAISFSRRITKPLLHLAKVADRISVGDLGASIEVKTKDEIRVLAEALRRMQISLKAAIERLRGR